MFVGLSWQEYQNGLPFPPSVDHDLPELFIVTHPSWVALRGMANSFIDLYRPPSPLQGCDTRILEWFAFSLFRGSSCPRIEPASPVFPALASGFFTNCVTWEVLTWYWLLLYSWKISFSLTWGFICAFWHVGVACFFVTLSAIFEAMWKTREFPTISFLGFFGF